MFYQDLADKINQRLQHDTRLSVYALKAKVYENGTVQIQGIVDVLEEKREAEEIVWGFNGVKMVENDITVCTDGGVDDADVRFEVSEELQANPDIPETVGVKVSGGNVQLVGSVRSKSEAQEAIETASKARGVREVQNQLKVEDEVDDATLANNIQSTLMAEPSIIPGRIKVLADNGVVTLWGNPTEEQAMLAMELAARVPGVKDIKNMFDRKRMAVDDQVVVRVMEKISANPYLNERPISIEVEEGRIILSGSLDTWEAKRDIEAVIQEILAEFKPVHFMVENKLILENKD